MGRPAWQTGIPRGVARFLTYGSAYELNGDPQTNKFKTTQGHHQWFCIKNLWHRPFPSTSRYDGRTPVPEPGPFVTRPVLPIGRDLEVAQDAIDGGTGKGEAAIRGNPCAAMVGCDP